MGRKIYVGTFEFDTEEKNIIIDALLAYLQISKRLNKKYYNICKYVLKRFEYLKEEEF